MNKLNAILIIYRSEVPLPAFSEPSIPFCGTGLLYFLNYLTFLSIFNSPPLFNN